MRYKINKHALFSRMDELKQNQSQRVSFLMHNIAVLMSKRHWQIFDCLSQGYNIYYMLLTSAFELLRLKYSDYLVIVQSTQHEFVIEIRKISVK